MGLRGGRFLSQKIQDWVWFEDGMNPVMGLSAMDDRVELLRLVRR